MLRSDVIDKLAATARDIVGVANVATDVATRACYSYDAFVRSAAPDVVATVQRVDQVAALIRAAVHHGVPYVARGAGTGYCGGVVPVEGGLVLVLTQLQGFEID